mgnify:CR=1 FL=1
MRNYLEIKNEKLRIKNFGAKPIITIIVSRNSVKLHCFDTKYMIWYRIFFENSTIILSMNVMQNCIYEKQFC